jgi:hypothetical protein
VAAPRGTSGVNAAPSVRLFGRSNRMERLPPSADTPVLAASLSLGLRRRSRRIRARQARPPTYLSTLAPVGMHVRIDGLPPTAPQRWRSPALSVCHSKVTVRGDSPAERDSKSPRGVRSPGWKKSGPVLSNGWHFWTKSELSLRMRLISPSVLQLRGAMFSQTGHRQF